MNIGGESRSHHSDGQKHFFNHFQRNRAKFVLFLIVCCVVIMCTLITLHYELTKNEIEKDIEDKSVHHAPLTQDHCTIISFARFDCFPRGHATEEACNHRGCCWQQSEEANIPSCFYPILYNSYNFVNVSESTDGIVAYMKLVKPSVYPDDLKFLRLDVNYVGEALVNIKVSYKWSFYYGVILIYKSIC